MSTQDKELLLKDLSARLLYRVKLRKYASINNYVNNCGKTTDETLDVVILYAISKGQYVGFRPYLRSMSSMTEEEEEEIRTINIDFDKNNRGVNLGNIGGCVSAASMSHILDYLNAHHFDYRGLIEKGLAIEVMKENNPYE